MSLFNDNAIVYYIGFQTPGTTSQIYALSSFSIYENSGYGANERYAAIVSEAPTSVSSWKLCESQVLGVSNENTTPTGLGFVDYTLSTSIQVKGGTNYYVTFVTDRIADTGTYTVESQRVRLIKQTTYEPTICLGNGAVRSDLAPGFMATLTEVNGGDTGSIYIETDMTNSLSTLTKNTNWYTSSGRTAFYAATDLCSAVTTNAGQTVQMCESYESNCDRTGDILYQTITGLDPGVYQIELYGAAAYTFGRGFPSAAFGVGIWTAGQSINENTGVTLFAETSEGTYSDEIPIFYAINFSEEVTSVTMNNVVVGSNGQVKIGMNKTSKSTNWHMIQLKDITAKIPDFKFLSNVTVDNPIEITNRCIVNPDFSPGNISGWSNTFAGKATYQGFAPNGIVYTNNGSAITGDTNNDDGNPAFLNKFFEAWRGEASPWTLGDAQLAQTVYGLPAGLYKLTCDAIAVYQFKNTASSNPVKGVKFFAATNVGTEVFNEIATSNGNPEHVSISIICPENTMTLTFGLKTENSTANWIAADNFRIYYYGTTEITQAHLELMTVIKKAQDTVITEDEKANLEILNNYIKVLENAEAISEKNYPTDEECIEATAALKAALAAAQQSIKDYVKLNELVEEAKDLSDKAYTAGFLDAADAVDNLWVEWEGLYEERTATQKLIESIDGMAFKTLKEVIISNMEKIKPGTDLTLLLENPGFTRGKGGTQLTAKDCVPGWVLNSGLIGEHRISTHNIEIWHANSDISQTIPNLPAGVYDVTLQGFVRHDNTGTTDGTWLYGGIAKANLIDLDRDQTQKVTERIFGNDKPGLGDENRDNSRSPENPNKQDLNEEGNPLYQCNGMTGAYYWFQKINPNTNELYYTNHLKVVHEKDGDLTIGIHCEAAEDWVIWDNFTLHYLGDGSSNGENTNNTLAMTEIRSYRGAKTMLPVYLTNENQITGVQFDLYLPDGITVATNSKGKLLINTTERMNGNYTISGNVIDNYVRIVGYSVDGDAFSGYSGDIINISLNISDDVADGDYTIRIKDIVLSDVNNTEYHPADIDAVLTVKGYMLGDVDDSGTVNINDVVCIINHILHKSSGIFIKEAADVDNNGAININDVVTLINRFILHRNNAPARKAPTRSVIDDNYLYLATIEMGPGEEKEVSMLLRNADEVKAVQGNIKLPEGLSFVTNSNGRLDVKNLDERSEDFTLSCALQEDGSMTFAHYSADGFAYDGSEGGIFTFKIQAATDAMPGNYEISLTDMVLSIGGIGYEETDRTSLLSITNTTGIVGIEVGTGTMYDLTGRCVQHSILNHQTRKGIYIVNGKKVIVK